MQNTPWFWLEYGLIRQAEFIEEAWWEDVPAECPTPMQKFWQSVTSGLEKLTFSFGLRWRVAYSPVCRMQ